MPPNATAQIQLVANTSQLGPTLQKGVTMVGAFAQAVKRSLAQLHLIPKNAASNQGTLSQWTKNALGHTGGIYITRGIDALVDQGKAVFDFNDKLIRFGIAARQTPAQLDDIGKAARRTAAATGIDANQVLDAGRAYIDLAGAEAFTIGKMDLLARAAQATGSDTRDLAGMMYQLTRSMKVADGEMEETMGGLINQAKDGAIEAKEMAREFAGILPLFARFGVLGREGTIQAGALFQVMRDGANSASEAGTMMQRVYAGIQSYAPRFEAEGVQVYKKARDALGRKVLLPFDVIFKNIQSAEAMKDPARIKKMFGRTEGWRGMLLGDEASRAMGGTDAKIDSTISRLRQLQEAGRMNGVIQKDLATYTESSAGRMAVAFEKMKNAAAEAFTPERIEKFVGAIEDLIDKVGPLAEGVGKVGDALGALYSVGKRIRGFVGNDGIESAVFATSPEEVARYAKAKGVTELEAYQQLEDIYQRGRNLKVRIRDALRDDKTTPESNRIAVESSMAPVTQWGVAGERELAERYIRESGLSADQVRKIKEEIARDRTAEDYRTGNNKSYTQADMGAELLKALNAAAPAIGRSVAASMSGVAPAVTLDGNSLQTSTANATNRRRSP